MDARSDRYAKKSYGTVSDLGTLLFGANKKKFSFGRFTVRRFKVSQEWMVSRVEDRTDRLVVESDEEKEI